MTSENKWKANLEKVAFMKEFPGLTKEWESTIGKSIEAVIPLAGQSGAAVIVFHDGSFVVAPPPTQEPSDLREGLNGGRRHLEPKHQQAYVEYDRLTAKDREAQRTARLENILGAIQNNLANIPELKDRLKALMKEWT